MAGIFDAFTGNAQSEGQANARSFLQDIRQETAEEIERGLNQGLATLQSGVQPQLDYLQQGFGQAQNLYGGLGGQAIGALQTGTGWGVQSIHDMLQPQVTTLGALYSESGAEREMAANMARSGLGIGDPSLARDAFRASPGYEFMLNEGLESIARNANRAGMLASGNQMRESQTYGSGLADKEWDDWMNRLFAREQLYAPIELQAGGKLADAYQRAGQSLADIQTGYGKAAGNVYAQQARDMSQLAAQLGGAQAGIFGTVTPQQAEFIRQLLGLKTQANTALATGQAQTFVGQGDAEAAASRNIINSVLGVANLGVNAFKPTGGFSFNPTAASSTSI